MYISILLVKTDNHHHLEKLVNMMSPSPPPPSSSSSSSSPSLSYESYIIIVVIQNDYRKYVWRNLSSCRIVSSTVLICEFYQTNIIRKKKCPENKDTLRQNHYHKNRSSVIAVLTFIQINYRTYVWTHRLRQKSCTCCVHKIKFRLHEIAMIKRKVLKHKTKKNLSSGWDFPAPWLSITQILGNVNIPRARSSYLLKHSHSMVQICDFIPH